MKKFDKEYKEILDKLKTAKPSEVGDILREYFSLKKKKELR